MIAYVLTDEAEADLRGVIRHTRKHWGDAQVRSYIASLEQGFVDLAAGQGPFKDMGELYPSLCMARCGHHYVFCWRREHAPALIVAILHERMDMLGRLAARLER